MVKILYLSGPMSGYVEHNFPNFRTWEERLTWAGYAVVSPAQSHKLLISRERCMREDIAALMTCDGIALMKGWEKSPGAKLEREIAEQIGLEVATVEEWVMRSE